MKPLYHSPAIQLDDVCVDVRAFPEAVVVSVLAGDDLAQDLRIVNDAATAALIDALQTALARKREANRH